MPTRLLVVDTATETLHLAVVVDGRVLARAGQGGAQASATLLPLIQALLAEAGVGLRDLDAIGFGRGPGAFTGLRTSVAVVQGLALGVDRPLLALDTLAAVAEAAALSGAVGPVWSAMDARMGEVYAGCWQRELADLQQPSLWRARTAVGLWQPLGLAESVAADAQAGAISLAGNALLAYAQPLNLAGVPGWPEAAPHGLALARLAQAAHAQGAWLDAAQALPLYVRDKVAQTTQERADAKAAAVAMNHLN